MKPLSLTFGERQLEPMDAAALEYLGADPKGRRELLAEARWALRAHRAAYGYRPTSVSLLTAPTAQPKLAKSRVPTYGLSLLPATGVGQHAVTAFGRAVNLCPSATPGCVEACLNTAGKGALNSVQRARLARTMFFLLQPEAAGVLLAAEIIRAAERHGEIRVRLNVLSDIRWELVLRGTLAALKGWGVRFYDYTKWAPSLRDAGSLIHLTYSASERWTDDDIFDVVSRGHNVAVVFAAPKEQVKRAVNSPSGALWRHGEYAAWLVDGLSTDDRTTDPSGVIVALSALGKGRADATGFVRPWPFAA